MEIPATFRVPNIQLGEPLGRGAFGAVFRARHLTLDLDVAVKIVSPTSVDPTSVPRALAEARLMARLDHPNLLRIFDTGHVGTALYLVLELMDGSCEQVRSLPAGRAVDAARQLLSGLQALHEARILHRDIKPANFLRRQRDDRLKLADLGIAVEHRTTARAEEFAGTLPFMAPDLFDSPPRYTPRPDLYALGLSLLCMLHDRDPFPTSDLPAIVSWVQRGALPRLATLRPDLPPTLCSIVDRLLARDPSQRPATAGECLAALATPTLAPEVAPAPRAARAHRSTVGPWLLGEVIYSSPNWQAHSATHVRTGAPARLSLLQRDALIASSAPLILRAAERASTLDHPGLLPVIDWGVAGDAGGGQPYVVTAPQGHTFEELVTASGPFDELEALVLARGLAEALAYLHREGLVHQVVTPGAAAIDREGRSAQLSWSVFCMPSGTPERDSEGRSLRALVPQFAAPEAIASEGRTIEAAVDLYGLGEILYYLLVGRIAHDGTTAAALLVQKLAPAAVRAAAPEVTAPTERLVQSLLAPDPGARPASAAQVAAELERLASRLRGPA